MLSVFLVVCVPARAVETLRVLTWPGYADVDLVKAFEKSHDVHVEVSFIASDDALRETISVNQSGNFDVFAANTAEMQYYITQNLIVPLQLSNIPNTLKQLPRFRNLRSIPGIARLATLAARQAGAGQDSCSPQTPGGR
jgi:putative spermidine/putrescine transport system substrate-binding protein